MHLSIDYCNGLLYGPPKNLISKLQSVQNTAARIEYCMPTFCYITPLLFDLHWLPVKFRIDYKIIIKGKEVHSLWVQAHFQGGERGTPGAGLDMNLLFSMLLLPKRAEKPYFTQSE